VAEVFEGKGRGFSFRADAREGILTIVAKGELDLAAANDLSEQMLDVVAHGERIVVMDFAGLAFMDSSGLRFVVELRQTVEKRGGRFLLGRLSGPVRRLLDIAGLSQWFEYLDGEAPQYTYCPVCDAELQASATRCPKCGSAF
jgi:anti-sigma B factor antagonist